MKVSKCDALPSMALQASPRLWRFPPCTCVPRVADRREAATGIRAAHRMTGGRLGGEQRTLLFWTIDHVS